MSDPAVIPDLGRKLALLRQAGPRTTKEQVAAAFGVTPKTVKWWVEGDRARQPGKVSAANLATMIGIFADALPPALSADHVRALVFGSYDDLERVLRSRGGPTLEDYIQREAKADRWSLHRAGDLSLVEIEDNPDLPTITLGERFRLAFDTVRPGHLFVLQHAQQTWGTVPLSAAVPSALHAGGRLDVPAQTGGNPVFLREDTMPGIHRFVIIATAGAFPVSLVDTARARMMLDRNALTDLADHLSRTPIHLRELHLAALRVVRR